MDSYSNLTTFHSRKIIWHATAELQDGLCGSIVMCWTIAGLWNRDIKFQTRAIGTVLFKFLVQSSFTGLSTLVFTNSIWPWNLKAVTVALMAAVNFWKDEWYKKLKSALSGKKFSMDGGGGGMYLTFTFLWGGRKLVHRNMNFIALSLTLRYSPWWQSTSNVPSSPPSHSGWEELYLYHKMQSPSGKRVSFQHTMLAS